MIRIEGSDIGEMIKDVDLTEDNFRKLNSILQEFKNKKNRSIKKGFNG